MSLEAKKALEGAVSKVGKALGELLKVAEKHGDDLSANDYDRARYFLDSTSAKLWDNIGVVRDIARATSGSFSLDDVAIPELDQSDDPVLIVPRTPLLTTTGTGLPDGRELAKQIGGRLTKAAREHILAQPAPSVISELTGDAVESSGMDGDDGVDFIDD